MGHHAQSCDLLTLPHQALPRITHWIKGRTARGANLLWGRAGGPFWQHQRYDRRVRNEREFQRIVAHIEENPVFGRTDGGSARRSGGRAGLHKRGRDRIVVGGANFMVHLASGIRRI